MTSKRGNYARFKIPGLQRVAMKDDDDWLVFGCAMEIGGLVWMEDADFFGKCFATWTADWVVL